MGSTVDICGKLKSPSYFPYRPRDILCKGAWLWRYFLSGNCNLLGLNYKLVWSLTNPSSSYQLLISPTTISNGILCSSSTSVSALFSLPNQTKHQKKHILSFFLAIQTKNLSTHSLTLPKDVCPWWVLLAPSCFCLFFSCLWVCYIKKWNWLFKIMQDLEKHHQKQKQRKTSTVFSLTLLSGLSLHSLRFWFNLYSVTDSNCEWPSDALLKSHFATKNYPSNISL